MDGFASDNERLRLMNPVCLIYMIDKLKVRHHALAGTHYCIVYFNKTRAESFYFCKYFTNPQSSDFETLFWQRYEMFNNRFWIIEILTAAILNR